MRRDRVKTFEVTIGIFGPSGMTPVEDGRYEFMAGRLELEAKFPCARCGHEIHRTRKIPLSGWPMVYFRGKCQCGWAYKFDRKSIRELPKGIPQGA